MSEKKAKTTTKKVAKKEVVKKTHTPKKEIKKEEVKKEIKVEEARTEKKAQVKKEETKKEATVEKKVVKKKVYIKKVKKENKQKSSEAKNNQVEKAKEDKKIPTFRGRFGKANIRRRNKAKWTKWRRPRGIDLDKGLNHGFRPKIGYRTKKDTRGIHPSGYQEVRVENPAQLDNINVKTQAIKIGSTVGKRKRNEIVTKANKKGIWILN